MARSRQQPDPPCPEQAGHTPQPEGYLAWHAWAERNARTHRQERCPGCGLFQVWVPKVTADV